MTGPMRVLGSMVPAERELEELPEAVSAEDLQRLPILQDIIGSLDDRRASARDIAKVVDRFPALAARVQNRYQRHFPTSPPPGLVVQIAMLGQRELEVVLFSLLEDLTILRAELLADSEATQASQSSKP